METHPYACVVEARCPGQSVVRQPRVLVRNESMACAKRQSCRETDQIPGSEQRFVHVQLAIVVVPWAPIWSGMVHPVADGWPTDCQSPLPCRQLRDARAVDDTVCFHIIRNLETMHD